MERHAEARFYILRIDLTETPGVLHGFYSPGGRSEEDVTNTFIALLRIHCGAEADLSLKPILTNRHDRLFVQADFSCNARDK
jgi:hypothetical protein